MRFFNTAGSPLELPPALARLVHRRERLSAQRLWNALDDGERLTALRIFVKRNENRNQLVRIVAEARRFRPATVAGMKDDKVIDMARRVPLDNALARSLLHMMHLERRREMLARFLDRLDIPNDDGRMQGSAGGDPGEAEVHGAAEDLVREHGLRRAVVYFLTLAIQRVSFAGHLWTWMEGLLARVDAPSQIASGVDGQDDVDLREEPDEQDDPARHRGFTTLDRLLVEAVVDSKQGVVGGLDADEIDDAVDEFVKLNGRRHHSHFHVGLRDVLFDRPTGQDLSASNRNIERWYWTGAIQGWARLERWARIAQAHDANAAVRGLGDGADFATDAGAVYVARALTREARSGEIADFARVEGLVRSQTFFLEVLHTGTALLREGEAAEAGAVFDRLMEAVRALVDQGFPQAHPLFLTVRRRHAHCLQRLHEHRRARQLLEGLLHLDPDPNHLAMVHADLGLLAGGFNSLEDVSLPSTRSELSDVLDRLREGRKHFLRSVENDVPYANHGRYCLGVLALGERNHREAEGRLQRARARFRARRRNYGDALVARTDLYFGISRAALARSAGDLVHAKKVIVDALEVGAQFPRHLIGPVVEGLEVGVPAGDLSEVARLLLDTQGDAALDTLAKSEKALKHCPGVADALRHRAGRLRGSEAAARDLRACLVGYVRSERIGAAEEVLDELEALAVGGIGAADFEKLLSGRRHVPVVWDPEEVAEARVRCLEARGETLDALVLLQELIHRYVTEGKLDEAEGLLDRIRRYGLDDDYFSDVAGRVSASRAEEEDRERVPGGSKALRSRPARVLFVGGDERQSRVEDAVRAKVRRRAPHVEVTFIHPGWSGNWSQHLEKVRAQMPGHDALVLMRFMRTELGKQIRRHCDKPWRSCWSSGHKGMADAILAAAEAAAEAG